MPIKKNMKINMKSSICSIKWPFVVSNDVIRIYVITESVAIIRSSSSQIFFKMVREFIKMKLQHRCFSINIAKFLKTALFLEQIRWLLLNYFKNTRIKQHLCNSSIPDYVSRDPYKGLDTELCHNS